LDVDCRMQNIKTTSRKDWCLFNWMEHFINGKAFIGIICEDQDHGRELELFRLFL